MRRPAGIVALQNRETPWPSSTSDWRTGRVAGVTQDDGLAVRWCCRAAEQGLAEAQYNLAVLYSQGCGVARDDDQAARWYRRAADQELAEAQFAVGLLYDQGLGVTQNHAEAVRWYRRAAEQGHAAAQGNLGTMYSMGSGVARRTKPKPFAGGTGLPTRTTPTGRLVSATHTTPGVAWSPIPTKPSAGIVAPPSRDTPVLSSTSRSCTQRDAAWTPTPSKAPSGWPALSDRCSPSLISILIWRIASNATSVNEYHREPAAPWDPSWTRYATRSLP